jgi:hypothetical protein
MKREAMQVIVFFMTILGEFSIKLDEAYYKALKVGFWIQKNQVF